MEDHSNSIADICRMLRISRSTLYRNLNGQAGYNCQPFIATNDIHS
ncbi:MAG: hypothetical protein IIB41_06675 [Candidatus Marinimicrobia bacterium]|nr:hypothetical protein [Candidatus Neomarinimicrobiota bacterium]